MFGALQLMSDLLKSLFPLAVSVLLFVSCSGEKKIAGNANGDSKDRETGLPGPKCIVYKTKMDYSLLVPVILSKERTSIVSYPDISDIRTKDGFTIPTPLAGGYLLDNRGIGPGVAFLSYTYESYWALQRTPPAAELLGKIIDRDPLVEMYDCGNRSKYLNIVKELNEIILNNEIRQFKSLK
jgi:hypothetical protein